MKYISNWMKFESKNSDYWEEISFEEFSLGRRYKIPNKYSSVISDLVIGDVFKVSFGSFIPSYLFIERKESTVKRASWVIRMGSDEWWYVDKDNSLLRESGPKHSYYKCDQFDGLLVFLRQEKVIR
jgi:hypothetical protein